MRPKERRGEERREEKRRINKSEAHNAPGKQLNEA
jgi:hypothetical protein